MNTQSSILDVEDLVKHYSVGGGFFGYGRQQLKAVDRISFHIGERETLGLVGESGCGKSTVGKAVLRLVEPTAGRVALQGEEITGLDAASLLQRRKRMQVIFQDPYSSLNPRMTAGDIVQEPLINFGIGNRAEQPHEFSGGQRQRLGIARALALGPSLIIGDEPVSALDVSVQAQVINLMMELQQEFGLSYLFIAHDLGVVEHISHRVAVMYLGKIVEIAPREALFKAPRHPYTEALLAAVPVAHPRARRSRVVLKGDVPSPINPPPGCRFHTRCPIAVPRCRQEEPQMVIDAAGHGVACHLRVTPA
jgi:oligopeptide/dipeptide ABC transporter ATP-binding protein